MNTTFRAALWADACFALDRAWFMAKDVGKAETYLEELRRTFAGEIVTSASAVPGVQKTTFNRRILNSGAAAVMLAHERGAERVILLGFDAQKGEDGKTVHHHGDHPPGLGNAGSMPKWPAQFALLASSVGRMPIINCSRRTALRCFPRSPLELEISAAAPARPTRALVGMLGLGDNIYQRAIVRELGPVQLTTPWPQIYADLPDVVCVRPETRLRTQAKNAARGDVRFAAPARLPGARMGYGPDSLTMVGSMLASVKIKRDALTFDGPPARSSGRSEAFVVIRPNTVRSEWPAKARNPRAEYLAEAADRMAAEGYRVISVADVDDRNEWLDGPAPPAHERFHRGELKLEDLLALVNDAAGVIGGVGWLLPAAMAYRVPMLLLFGGWGRPNGPHRIFDPRIDSSMIVRAMPDRFCMCNDRAHSCDRTISNLGDHLDRFVRLARARRAPLDSVARSGLPRADGELPVCGGLLEALPGSGSHADRGQASLRTGRPGVSTHPAQPRRAAPVR